MRIPTDVASKKETNFHAGNELLVDKPIGPFDHGGTNGRGSTKYVSLLVWRWGNALKQAHCLDKNGRGGSGVGKNN